MSSTVRGGGGLTLAFDPARGAKITSIWAGGTEWLAQPDDRPTPQRGTAFTDAEMAGWDECAPSIVACTVGQYLIPDHGDLWDQPFALEGARAVAVGSSFPYRFEREIVPTSRGVRLHYRATALAEAIPFLWAAHPQFSAPPGTRVVLDDMDGVVDVLAEGEPTIAWDVATSSIDSLDDGGSRKIYVSPDSPTFVARLERLEGVLELRWSQECPYLGVWFDHCAYSREPVIALEPSTGYYDSLDRAAARGSVVRIPAQGSIEWWLDIAVDDEAQSDRDV